MKKPIKVQGTLKNNSKAGQGVNDADGNPIFLKPGESYDGELMMTQSLAARVKSGRCVFEGDVVGEEDGKEEPAKTAAPAAPAAKK